jgi:hypothetical protein
MSGQLIFAANVSTIYKSATTLPETHFNIQSVHIPSTNVSAVQSRPKHGRRVATKFLAAQESIGVYQIMGRSWTPISCVDWRRNYSSHADRTGRTDNQHH